MKFYLTIDDLRNWVKILDILEHLGVPEPDIYMGDDDIVRAAGLNRDYAARHNGIFLVMSYLGVKFKYSYDTDIDTRPYAYIPDDKALELKLMKP